ncbi:MAG: tRNA dihydrouridine(20/20a) synthase DusA [Alphaproteobacteria bacterium]
MKIFAVAPMMDWTDRHCRSFHRSLSARALLYTEMVTAEAILHGDRERLIGFDAGERPVALQIGGSDPERLAAAAEIGAARGYDEINLNVGCPSARVQSGRFGACLMAEPELVADCLAAMRASASPVPVTIKCRVGIDDQSAEEALPRFVRAVADAGITTVIVHARKAWLSGLSPKENRDVPPLEYALVYAVKRAFPDLTIVLNGGIESLAAARAHLAHVDGVMLGRAAYHDPAILMEVDAAIFGGRAPMRTRHQAVMDFLPVIEEKLSMGVPLAAITRHMLGLFNGFPGARAWRRALSEEARRSHAGIEVVLRALASLHEPRREVAEFAVG